MHHTDWRNGMPADVTVSNLFILCWWNGRAQSNNCSSCFVADDGHCDDNGTSSVAQRNNNFLSTQIPFARYGYQHSICHSWHSLGCFWLSSHLFDDPHCSDVAMAAVVAVMVIITIRWRTNLLKKMEKKINSHSHQTNETSFDGKKSTDLRLNSSPNWHSLSSDRIDEW